MEARAERVGCSRGGVGDGAASEFSTLPAVRFESRASRVPTPAWSVGRVNDGPGARAPTQPGRLFSWVIGTRWSDAVARQRRQRAAAEYGSIERHEMSVRGGEIAPVAPQSGRAGVTLVVLTAVGDLAGGAAGRGC